MQCARRYHERETNPLSAHPSCGQNTTVIRSDPRISQANSGSALPSHRRTLSALLGVIPTVWRRADDFIAWYLGIPIPAVVRERGFGGHRTWDEGRRQEQKLPRIIEWLRNPMVEVRGFVHKQQVSEWLALAQGKRYRTMTAKNKTFVWAPDDDPICLYSSGVGAPETHARLNDSRRSRRGGGP
ncbi:hypothetical protein R3P38DRAFT_2794788 [Favolaschia claudopus]|uniref:Transposase n=1 Tax=Favolaschia claudopus TaxID=2862362 RepID=A0AAW0A8N3_9AGAR